MTANNTDGNRFEVVTSQQQRAIGKIRRTLQLAECPVFNPNKSPRRAFRQL